MSKNETKCTDKPVSRHVYQWAELLEVFERKLWQLIRLGEIKATRISPAITVIETEGIERWLKSKRDDPK